MDIIAALNELWPKGDEINEQEIKEASRLLWENYLFGKDAETLANFLMKFNSGVCRDFFSARAHIFSNSETERILSAIQNDARFAENAKNCSLDKGLAVISSYNSLPETPECVSAFFCRILKDINSDGGLNPERAKILSRFGEDIFALSDDAWEEEDRKIFYGMISGLISMGYIDAGDPAFAKWAKEHDFSIPEISEEYKCCANQNPPEEKELSKKDFSEKDFCAENSPLPEAADAASLMLGMLSGCKNIAEQLQKELAEKDSLIARLVSEKEGLVQKNNELESENKLLRAQLAEFRNKLSEIKIKISSI
ncbi:MAG: TMF family protein [Firmicutes bacterium]|nr:TMF family protein [Bacillota bacterium]